MTQEVNHGVPRMAQDAQVENLIVQFRTEIAAHSHSQSIHESGLSIDELVRRLDAELGVQSDMQAAHIADPLPIWMSSQADLPQRDAYALHELLQFDDARFIDTSYRVLLRRMPDPTGGEYYLSHLRRGELSRIGVLAALRWSPEGIARGVHVDGLLLPHLLERCQRWPIVGPLIGWLRGLARLHTISSRLESLRHAHAQELEAIGEAHNRLAGELGRRLTAWQSETDKHAALLRKVGERLDALQTTASRRFDALDSASERSALELKGLEATTSQRFDALDSANERSAAELMGLEQRFLQGLEERRTEIEELQRITDANAFGLDEHRKTSEAEVARLQLGVNELAETMATADRIQQARMEMEATHRHALDPLYTRFEDHFRGTQEEIRRRAEVYLPLVRQPGIGDPGSPVVDIGSGRGEWLDALRESGVHAFGIDTNQTFVADCRARGLAVTEGDALATLATLPDASAGAVTSMHLVEHLPFEALVELLDQAHRILKPGGVLLLETPNPENMNVGAHWFYLDPTHRNPLPPTMLAWLVEDRGFSDVEIRGESEHRGFVKPELLPEDAPGASQINGILAGYRAAPDYAVVAWRR